MIDLPLSELRPAMTGVPAELHLESGKVCGSYSGLRRSPRGRRQYVEIDGVRHEVGDDQVVRFELERLPTGRLDLFWLDYLWTPGPTWWSTEIAEQFADTLPDGNVLHRPRRERSRAWDRLDRALWRDDRRGPLLRLVAVLCSWPVVTRDQLAAMAGVTRAQVDKLAATLVACGLAERGRFVTEATHPLPSMFRVVAGEPLDELLSLLATYAEWMQVTGGYKPVQPQRAARHSSLIAELVLRLIEADAPLGAAFGENLASASQLAPEHAQALGFRADGMLLRAGDGRRLAVEVQAHQGSLSEKAARWARLLDSVPPERLGLDVLWVNIARPGAGLSQVEFERQVSAGLAQAGPWARKHNFIAEWSAWFPGRWLARPGWTDLPAYRPGSRQPVALLDRTANPGPGGSAGLTHTLQAANHLWACPADLRFPAPAPAFALPTLRDTGPLERQIRSAIAQYVPPPPMRVA